MLFHALHQKYCYQTLSFALFLFALVSMVYSAAIPTPGVQSTPSTPVKVYISSGREPSRSRSSFSAVPGCDLKFESMQKLHAALLPVIQKAVPASGSMIPSNWVPVFWSAPSVYWTKQAGYIIPFSVSFDDDSLKNMNTGSGQIKLNEDTTHSGYVFWREGEAVKIEIDEKTVIALKGVYHGYLSNRITAARQHHGLISYSPPRLTHGKIKLNDDTKLWAERIRNVITAAGVQRFNFAQHLCAGFQSNNYAFIYQIGSEGAYSWVIPFSFTPPGTTYFVDGTIEFKPRDSGKDEEKARVLSGRLSWEDQGHQEYELDMITIRELARQTQFEFREMPGVSYRVTYTKAARGYTRFRHGQELTPHSADSLQAAIAKALHKQDSEYDVVLPEEGKPNMYIEGQEYFIPFDVAEELKPNKPKSGRLVLWWGQRQNNEQSGPVARVAWDGAKGYTEADLSDCIVSEKLMYFTVLDFNFR
ncbi:hypothetical protein F5880DRAFT_1570166 [Lentinula raphanica]|nr:hypothetical protein F5880DRAFT_1570166 [Lentinula raphanica]